MKFRSAEQAVRFAYNISDRAEYARSNFLGVRGTSQDDLSPTDLHAQAAMIHSMIERLHPVERDAILAMYGRGKTRADAIRGLSDYLMPHVRGLVPGIRELRIVVIHWATKRPSIRSIADGCDVSFRRVCAWRTSALRAWMPLHVRAMDRLHGKMFGTNGFELEQ